MEYQALKLKHLPVGDIDVALRTGKVVDGVGITVGPNFNRGVTEGVKVGIGFPLMRYF